MNPSKQKKREKTDEMSFGEILKKHRSGQNYSLRKLESQSGVSASYLSRLEKGEASATYEVITKIADAFGIEPSEFFPGHGGFSPSFRKEFGEILEDKTIQVMLRSMTNLDPYALRAVAVATTHWIELLKRGLRPVPDKAGVYKINYEFVEEMEKFKGFIPD
jgi:transcriptional regulator with XRE-family HTH domain